MESPQKELPQIGSLPFMEDIASHAVDPSQVYACETKGDCMEPAFRAGEYAIVCPLTRPERGDRVLLYLEGEEKPLLKQLVLWITSGDIEPVIIVEQLNPPKHLYYKPAQVRAVHTVIGRHMAERLAGVS